MPPTDSTRLLGSTVLSPCAATSSSEPTAPPFASGLVTIDSPQTAGRVGFAATPTQVGPVTLDLTPEFAVATVTTLDSRPLGESGHLLSTPGPVLKARG